MSAEDRRRREQWEQEWKEGLARRRRGGQLNYIWNWPAHLVGSDWRSPYVDGKRILPMEVCPFFPCLLFPLSDISYIAGRWLCIEGNCSLPM